MQMLSVVVFAARAMDMRGSCCGDGNRGESGRRRWCVMRVRVVMASVRVAAAGVRAALGFKALRHLIHDQVHGTQHVG